MFNTFLEFTSITPVVLIQLNIVLEHESIKPTNIYNFCCEIELPEENTLIGTSSETFLKSIRQLFRNNNYYRCDLAGKKLDNLEYRFVQSLESIMFARLRMDELRILVSK